MLIDDSLNLSESQYARCLTGNGGDIIRVKLCDKIISQGV